jgi:hypothetical protein
VRSLRSPHAFRLWVVHEIANILDLDLEYDGELGAKHWKEIKKLK